MGRVRLKHCGCERCFLRALQDAFEVGRADEFDFSDWDEDSVAEAAP
jgi:hypothetical protein